MHGVWNTVIESLRMQDEWHVCFTNDLDYYSIRFGVRKASYRMGVPVRIHRRSRRVLVVTLR
jgi:hypothetical protein